MELLYAFLAILFQSIFTASETALIRLDRLKLKEQAKAGLRWARAALDFLERPEEFFTIILICEDCALVAASIFLERFFVHNFGGKSTIFAVIVLSLVSLIIGQFLPKAAALHLPEQIMSALAGFLSLLKQIIRPVSLAFSFLAKIIYRSSRPDDFPFHRRDIVTALNEIERSASRILARLFAFSETKVEDVMIPSDEVIMLPHSITIEQIQQQNLLKKPYTRIPIYHDDPTRVTHVINLRDIIYHGKIIFRRAFNIETGMRAMALFKKMQKQGEHMAIVVDSQKCMLGIVTMDDLIEELVGEIRDEM